MGVEGIRDTLAVLILNGDQEAAGLVVEGLPPEPPAWTARSGAEVLETNQEQQANLDVALIDRLLLDVPDDKVLMRPYDAEGDYPAALMTATQPSFSIVNVPERDRSLRQ